MLTEKFAQIKFQLSINLTLNWLEFKEQTFLCSLACKKHCIMLQSPNCHFSAVQAETSSKFNFPCTNQAKSKAYCCSRTQHDEVSEENVFIGKLNLVEKGATKN